MYCCYNRSINLFSQFMQMTQGEEGGLVAAAHNEDEKGKRKRKRLEESERKTRTPRSTLTGAISVAKASCFLFDSLSLSLSPSLSLSLGPLCLLDTISLRQSVCMYVCVCVCVCRISRRLDALEDSGQVHKKFEESLKQALNAVAGEERAEDRNLAPGLIRMEHVGEILSILDRWHLWWSCAYLHR